MRPVSHLSIGYFGGGPSAFDGPAPPPRAVAPLAVRRRDERISSPEEARRLEEFGDGARGEVCDYPAGGERHVAVRPTEIVIVVALKGAADIAVGADRARADGMTAVLLARRETSTATWAAGSRELRVHLPREGLQALASAEHGGARRLAVSGPRPIVLAGCAELNAALADFAVAGLRGAPDLNAGGRSIELALGKALLAALLADSPLEELLPLSRSVTEAMRRVSETPARAWDAESLAAAVGVTAPALRRRFRASLGMSVGKYLLDARLEQARRSLESGCDSRPMSALAKSMGFETPGGFTRAYVRLFGETPTVTRARAVREGRGGGSEA